jgi:hypothetical protein
MPRELEYGSGPAAAPPSLGRGGLSFPSTPCWRRRCFGKPWLALLFWTPIPSMESACQLYCPAIVSDGQRVREQGSRIPGLIFLQPRSGSTRERVANALD